MIRWLKERKLRKQMDELVSTALRRRDGTLDLSSGTLKPNNRYRDWYEFLNSFEQRRYSLAAVEHYDLLRKKGKFSPYFSPKRDAFKNEPNSPDGYITVNHNASTKFEMIYLNDLDPRYAQWGSVMVKNGELQLPNWMTEEQQADLQEKFEASRG